MASAQKARLLFLRDYLLKYTDEEHMLSRIEIEEILRDNGFECGRKTFYDDCDAIRESGIDIESSRFDGGEKYYVGNRDFQLSEVKLLIDAVSCSRFLTLKKTEELIGKLESLASVHQAEQLKRQVFVKNRVKGMNETIYYASDTVYNAINLDKAVTFKYFKWAIDESGNPIREYRHNGEYYKVSPWGVIWSDENYYMIGFDHKSQSVKHFRVDRMRNVSVSDDERIKNEEFEHLDIESYSSSVFRMFGGQVTYVEMLVPNELADVFVDHFGSGVNIRRSDAGSFVIGADIAVSRQFYAWLLGLSAHVSIISPPEIVEDMNSFISEIKK